MRRLLLGVVVAGVATVLAAPASAATPIPLARASVTLSGSAGTFSTLHLSRTVYLNNAGGDVSLSSPGSQAVGILIVRSDAKGKYASQDFYQETYGGDLGLCGRSPCAVPGPVRTWAWGGSDPGASIRLRAGTYLVVLLAERSHNVTARLHLSGLPAGTLAMRTGRAAIGDLTVAAPTVSVQGHDAMARGYQMSYSPHRVFAGNLAMLSFGSPGVLDYETCGDVGDGPPPPQPTLCLSGGGVSPDPVVTTKIGGTVYGTAGPIAYGPPDGHYGLGYTISIAAPGTPRIRVAQYHVTLLW
jgi:hypothetical protein